MTENLLALAWQYLNSAPGVTLLGGLVLWALNAVYARRPEWQKYEGTIIAAIRAAEKAIPDDVPMKSAERLDKALKYVLNVYESRTGKTASTAMVAEFAEAIQVIHARVEKPAGPELAG